MALLGHTARYVIPSEKPDESAQAWEAIGFTIESQSENAVRLTDGQILISLLNETLPSPALAYFHADPDRLVSYCRDKDLTTNKLDDGSIHVPSPFGVDIYVHHRPFEEHLAPTRESNELLGFFDSLVVGVDDISIARANAESFGFFVQEEWAGAHPQSDVTDGLTVVSLRKQNTSGIFSYTTELSETLVDEMDIADGALTVSRDENGHPWFVRIQMPDDAVILVARDT